jgi:hypothetical protein
MERDLFERVNWVHEAEDRLLATTPHTPEWRNAQRDAVRARADYWMAAGDLWDLNHQHETPLPRPRRPA